MDESTDKTDDEHMVILLRYLYNAKVKTPYVGHLELVEDGRAETCLSLPIAFFRARNLPFHKLLASDTDGAYDGLLMRFIASGGVSEYDFWNLRGMNYVKAWDLLLSPDAFVHYTPEVLKLVKIALCISLSNAASERIFFFALE